MALRLYRWAVRLLPRSFRERYRDEALRDFRSVVERREEHEGTRGVLKALVGGLGDVVRRAPAQRIHEQRRRIIGPGGWVDMWRRELRTAVRSLWRRPGFSTVAALTLALGIGATVAIFAVVEGVLLEPLSFPESERVVSFRHHAPGLDLPDLGNSEGTINFYRESARSLESIAVLKELSRNVHLGERAERVSVVDVTPSFFTVVRTRPALGRAFTEAEAEPGGPAVAILSHAAWTARYGGDRSVLGRTLRIEGRATEIIGVMPEGFVFPDPDVMAYTPMHISPDGPFGTFGLDGIGRLAAEVSLEDARSEMSALQQRMAGYFPDLTPQFFEEAGWSVTIEPYRDLVVGDVAAALWIVLVTVAFVLVIAAANVANLFLVRAEGRQREIALRAALGAGRRRLAAVFLSESLVLGAAAGWTGVVLAWVGLEALVAMGPAELPRLHAIELDGTVLLFAGVVSVLVSAALGSLPALRYLSGSPADTLRESGRSATGGRARHRARNLLVVSQLALALVLLVGSGLMLRSFQQLRSVDVGVEPENVLTMRVSLGQVEEPTEAVDFYELAADAVRALPGVRTAGVTNALPLGAVGLNGGSFHIESQPTPEDELPPVSMWVVVGDGFFEALGVPLLGGRAPTRADGRAEPPVVWVNETFARAFTDGSAVGERVKLGDSDEEWREIVGVVGDVRHLDLREGVRPMIYLPLSPGLPTGADVDLLSLAVKTAVEPTEVVSGVRNAIASVRADVPLTATYTMDEVLAESMADTSFTMTLLGIAALMALLLASVGIYGVIAYVVSQRTREIGVRMALGADAGKVRGMVLRQGMGVTAIGIALGLVGAFGLTRLMESVLFEVSATDPGTFVGVPVLLAAMAALASYLPALRATRIDPSEALRSE